MSKNTTQAVEAYANAMSEHSNEAKFGAPSKINCKVKELPNFETLRAEYIAAFDSLVDVNVDSLKRNELALIKAVSHGSIKTAQEGGKSAYDILTNVQTSRAITTENAMAKLIEVFGSKEKAIDFVLSQK